ncbi:RDD family protein [Sporosarcina beigongshangi]|uniref:RDD family protein n=1 Tax=Sporosarcina beigongshangi TaxID=2782538 RepID=UPI00193AABCE|nr:RDD family protein [Sporosarcina beigongshangi]
MSEFMDQAPQLPEQSVVVKPAMEYETVQIEHFRPKYAGFWTRFWAYTIDLLVLYAISGIMIKPIFRVVDIDISNPAFLFFSPYKITALLLLFLYFTLMTKYMGQTVGKMIMGIKVVAKNGEQLTWSAVVFREVFGRFISKMLMLPYLLVLFMPKKEALHDVFADTVVEYEAVYEKELRISQRQQLEGQQLQE